MIIYVVMKNIVNKPLLHKAIQIDSVIRREVLYPAELRGHIRGHIYIIYHIFQKIVRISK